MSAFSVLSITPLRHNIYSFVCLEEYKIVHTTLYVNVVKQLATYFKKKELLASISQGCKKVCTDFETPCVMCYYYGFYDTTEVCLYHYGQSPDTYISYVYYKKLISMYKKDNPSVEYFLTDISDYEEYRKKRDKLEEEMRKSDFYY